MASEADILREFLVRLGFQVDKASAKLFDDKISAGTKAAMAFGASVTAAAVAVGAAVKSISERLEELYWGSQRIQASAGNIRGFEYAISQLGGTSDGARASLESLARFMRNSPGAEGLLRNLGIHTRDENGDLRDTVDLMGELGTALRAMPYYKANAYAGVLGIDERTLMAIRNGTGAFAKEYHDLLKRAGLDMTQATKDGAAFTRELRGMNTVLGVLVTKFVSLLSAKFAQNMRGLREFFIANLDRIVAGIETVVRVVGGIIDALSQLFHRAVEVVQDFIEWVARINPLFLDIAKAVGFVAVAWMGLNAVLAAGPVGIVLALGAAMLALYDDYKTFAEGGKSLIDWGAWSDEVQLVADAFDAIKNAVETLVHWLNRLGRAWADSAAGPTIGKWAAKVFAFLGNKEAKRAVAVTEGREVPPEGPGAAQGTPGARSVLPGPAGSPVQSATSSGAPRVTPAQVKLNTDKAMQFFVASGWSKEQAAGIVANLRQESGLNENAVGDKGSALGIAQWHPDRQANFAKWAGHDLKGSSMDEQLKFVQYELTQGAEKHAGDMLRATKSADLAGQVMSLQYERPADQEGEAQKRGDAAVQISQTTQITVNGAADAQGTAKAVAAVQDDVNNQLTRNTRGAVR